MKSLAHKRFYRPFGARHTVSFEPRAEARGILLLPVRGSLDHELSFATETRLVASCRNAKIKRGIRVAEDEKVFART
jgi:hypothetical protein